MAKPTRDNAIWKYQLPFVAGPSFEVEMPEHAVVLAVQFQQSGIDAATCMVTGRPQMWALVNVSNGMVKREFVVLATGQPVDAENLQYVGTWQDASYVWHLFEVLR